MTALLRGRPMEKFSKSVQLVILKKATTLTERQVIAPCCANLTGCKQPKRVAFCTKLTKTPMQKLLRRGLRSLRASES